MTDARTATPSGEDQVRSPLRAIVFGLALVVATLASGAPALAIPGLHPPDIILLSQTARGQSAEGRSQGPAVNENGLSAAYASNALNLVSPPFINHRNQVYARDVEVITSALVSKSDAGSAGNRDSQSSGFPPGITGDGRLVAFSSLANNLVPGDTNGQEDVFVFDRDAQSIELISRGTNGPANGGSTLPKISADGRYVVFQSTASNLVDDDGNGFSDIFLYDRAEQRMVRVSAAPDGGPANGNSITPNISADGRVVAFASRATNLVATPTTGTFEQIFVTEWSAPHTELASVNAAHAPGNAVSFLPALNRDGSQVAFKSEAFNLVPNDTNGVPDVFVRDRSNDTTQRVSVDDFGNQSNGLSGGPGISGDGRFIAFVSFASNLVPEDGNGQSDAFVYDRIRGRIARVSVGMHGEDPNDGVTDFPLTISLDGRWIGFASAATNLVPNDVNSEVDAFLACNPFDEFDCAPPTPTPSETPTPTPTTEMPHPCVGDCNGDGQVTIDDLIRMVSIALGLSPLCPNDLNGGCLAGDANCDCEITVDEIIRAVQNSLQGCHDYGDCTLEQDEQMCCAVPPGTRTATPTRTITPTPSATPSTGTMVCVGDCNGSGGVSINELIRMVNIALGLQALCPSDSTGGCLAGDANCDCRITVDEIIQGVNNALNGCTHFTQCPAAQHEASCCGP
jgi:Tol biopolymer transport system component